MEIKTATMEHLPRINQLYASFYESHAEMQPAYWQPVPDSTGYITDSIQGENSAILLAVENGDILGFARISAEQNPPYDSYVPHRFVVLMDLMVDEQCRGKGVGRALIAATKAWGQQRGLDYLELTVIPHNTAALRLYQQEGLEIVTHVMRVDL